VGERKRRQRAQVAGVGSGSTSKRAQRERLGGRRKKNEKICRLEWKLNQNQSKESESSLKGGSLPR